MRRLEFDSVFDLTEKILPTLDKIDDEYPAISVYGHYDVIKQLLEDLIMNGVEIAESIELESYQINNYDKEFVLYLTEDGVSVCKCWGDGRYLDGDSNVSFIHGECSSKLLEHISSDVCIEFCIGDDEDEDEYDCVECQCDEKTKCAVKSDDGGYTIAVKCDLGTDEAIKIIKDMERRMEHMNDMFDKMCQSNIRMFNRLRW